MKRILHESQTLGERVIEGVHESGLRILICPKPEFTATHALFGTRYGSIDTRFRRVGEPDFADVPEGIAHFLEHKLFESEEGDAFARFAATGASANAYTTFDRTCYLFSCSDRWEENLDILLDFVRHPYFTEQTVQKEQGIIGQEIRMYDDSPDWVVFFGALQALYAAHPVRIDIAGTVDSIAQITADTLYRCYNTFYNPSNMFLCIAGPVDPDVILDKAEALFAGAEGVAVERGTFEEPEAPAAREVNREMAVAMPQFVIGYKETPDNGPLTTLRERAETDVLLALIAGRSSRLYNALLEQGLINDEFDSSFFTGHGYAVTLFQGESRDPAAVAAALQEEIERLRREGIDEEAFLRAKNSLYGHSVMMYNSMERIAGSLVECAMEGTDPFEADEAYRRIEKRDLEVRLRARFDPARRVLSTVTPIKE